MAVLPYQEGGASDFPSQNLSHYIMKHIDGAKTINWEAYVIWSVC